MKLLPFTLLFWATVGVVSYMLIKYLPESDVYWLQMLSELKYWGIGVAIPLYTYLVNRFYLKEEK